ncbi:MAG: hypothetical protein P0Y59_02555 [Candidatus Sphingomonas phytovorans]|nr:hypothetical protein [Sphingomonas sp.]WEK00592.1 MAG: hypothetical protein P0Y59_02555 [Sphingomonas sp.]
MPESLGEALLYLRTDDRGLDAGISNAKGKSEGLGRTLDATSGSASRLGKALDDTGSSAGKAGGSTAEYSRDVARLKAQIDPAWGSLQKFRSEAVILREALDAGAITHKQYVETMRQNASAAGLLTNAGKQVTAMTGGQRAGVNQLIMNIGDMSTMYSMGARPAQIFASQIGQITQAVQLASGGTSKFATFLGGPYGMALALAVQLGGPFLGFLFESKTAADKAAEANETLTQKLDRQKHSLAEVSAALKEYNGEQAKARETALQQAEAAKKAADAQLKEALAIRTKLAAELEARRASASANMGQGAGGAAGAFSQGQLTATEQKIKDNEKQIADLRKQAREAGANLADERSQIDADPVKKTREGFAKLQEQAKATITDVDKLTARLTALREQEDEAVKKIRESGRSRDTTAADASLGDMTALLKKLFPGARITSTTGGKHAVGSDHPKGKAIDFVPQGGMGTYTTAEVEKILEEAGVTIRRNASGTKQIFGPGRSAGKPGDHDDHFHFAWTGGASPEEAERRKAQADAKKLAAQEKEDRRVERYSRDLAGLQQAAADIQKRMADTAEERAKLELQGLEIATGEQARRITASKDYTEAQKLQLLLALSIKDSLERQLIEQRKNEELARQAFEVAQAQRANARDLLQNELKLAETRETRHDIELRLLDLTYEQEKAALDAVLASTEATEAQKKIAQARLAILGQLKAGDRAAIEREYENPVERYQRELRNYGAGINDELAKVPVNGLQKLEDRLVETRLRLKELGAAFKDVANQIISDLLRIAVRQWITAPLAGLLFGGGGGGGAASGGGGIFGSLFGSVLGGLFGGGKSNVPAGGSGTFGGGMNPNGSYSFAGLFADGGLIPNGHFGIVGEAGPEPIFATGAGIGVMPNSALRGMDNSRPGTLNVTVSGARGNAEIEDMVRSGVSQGIASYDRVVGSRVRDNLARRS